MGRLKGRSFSFWRYACTVGTNIFSRTSPNFFESRTPDSELIACCTILMLLSLPATPLPCFLEGVIAPAAERSIVREVLEFKPSKAYSFIFFMLKCC